MPQGVELYIPFPSRISPDFDRAQACHLDWPRSFGLLPTPAAEQRHLSGHYGELAARFHPSATGADLDLAVDQQSWYFIFDDHFSGPHGRDPVYARSLVAAVAAVLDASASRPSPRDGAPLVRAFADLWARSCDGMPATWLRRAARHWRAYLQGYVIETMNRRQRTVASFKDQLKLRMDTVGVAPVLDLAERVGHFEVAERTYRSPLLTAMRRITHETVIFDNEIASVEKEEASGECNLILQLQRENGCSRSRAITMIAEIIRKNSEEFLDLERRFPGLCREAGFDERHQLILDRYRVDVLRSMMRGAYDWGKKSGRYAATREDGLRSRVPGMSR